MLWACHAFRNFQNRESGAACANSRGPCCLILAACSDDALLHAAETRTSAPLRIDRQPDSLQCVTMEGLYPCGEGGWPCWTRRAGRRAVHSLDHLLHHCSVQSSRADAGCAAIVHCAGSGYAGGIVSAAVDGLRVGGAIAAELTGRAGPLDASAFKVKGSY